MPRHSRKRKQERDRATRRVERGRRKRISRRGARGGSSLRLAIESGRDVDLFMSSVSPPAHSASAAAKRRQRNLPFAIFAGVVAVVLYFELKPQPSIASAPFMPRPLGLFFDEHDFLNNILAFGALAAATHYAFCGWRRENGSRLFGRAAIVALGVVALEFAQAFVPNRSCDWHDMVAGWIGIAVASAPWLRGGRPVLIGHDRS